MQYDISFRREEASMAYPNLRAEIARFNCSIDEVAEAADVEPRTVQNWLAGRTSPNVAQCAAIRDRLFSFATVDYLFATVPRPI